MARTIEGRWGPRWPLNGPERQLLTPRLLHTLCPSKQLLPLESRVGLPSRRALNQYVSAVATRGLSIIPVGCPVPGLYQATASCLLVCWSLLDVILWWNKK